MQLFKLIQDVSAHAGIDIRRYRPLVHDPFAAQKFLLQKAACRIVFDVGAFQGDVTEQYTQAFPNADIYAFEPFATTYEGLTRRFAGNKQVHLVNAAVSSQTGEAMFHVNELTATNSLLARPSAGRQYFPSGGKTARTIAVPTTTLDDYCAQNNIASPDVLKLDIQGNELEALRGAERILGTCAINLIFTEVTFVPHYEGGVLFGELSSHLNSCGYSLFGLYNLHWAALGQIRFGDAIFVSEKLRRDFIDKLPAET